MTAPASGWRCGCARRNRARRRWGMIAVILMVGALFPSVGGSIGKLDLPRASPTARRRRLRHDHRLDAQRDRRGLRAAGGRRQRRSPPPPARSPARRRTDPRAGARPPGRAHAAAAGQGRGGRGQRRRHRAGHPRRAGGRRRARPAAGSASASSAALALHLAFFGLAFGALALALGGTTGRPRGRRRRRRGLRRPDVPRQRLRPADRPRALAEISLAVPLLRGQRPARERRPPRRPRGPLRGAVL